MATTFAVMPMLTLDLPSGWAIGPAAEPRTQNALDRREIELVKVGGEYEPGGLVHQSSASTYLDIGKIL